MMTKSTNYKFPSMNDNSQKKSTKVSHSCVLKNGLASIFIFNNVEAIGRNRHLKLIGRIFLPLQYQTNCNSNQLS